MLHLNQFKRDVKRLTFGLKISNVYLKLLKIHAKGLKLGRKRFLICTN